MEEYASNSHKSRQERNVELPEKKPEKVVTGEVVTRKKSGVRKFADSLISCGVENVRDYIFDEIVAPKVKDMIINYVNLHINEFMRRGRKCIVFT